MGKYMLKLISVMILSLCCPHVLTTQIPKDVEILEGFEFEDSPEYYATDASNYYEARSLLSGINKSIRNKRSALNQNNANQNVENAQNQNSEAQAANNMEQLPKAERQVMDPDYDYYAQRRISPTWNEALPLVQNTQNTAENEDTVAEASSAYSGVPRHRQARVNFVTQHKKDNDQLKDISETHITKVQSSKPAYYNSKYDNLAPAYNYDSYPSRSYEPYLRRYDRFDEQYSRYDPYNYGDMFLYRRHYDPFDSYSPRMPQYPEPYYNYPDQRFDIPEPRDFVPLHNNEIYDKGPLPAGSYPQPAVTYPAAKYPDYPRQQRRIVYYAHLPEIVRTPYDYSNQYNQYQQQGMLTASKSVSGSYKYEKSGSSVSNGETSGGSSDIYDYMKRDKKDRVTAKPMGGNSKGIERKM